MREIGDSEIVKELVRQGLRGKTAGTVEPSGMKERAAATMGAGSQLLPQAGGETALEGRGRVGMLISEGRVIRARPRLIIIDGGIK